MELYTYWIPHGPRLRDLGIPLIDSTVKSGAGPLAPDWSMVMAYKNGRLPADAYQDLYLRRLDFMWFHCPAYFDWLLTHPQIAFGCYCRPGAFCHRHLLTQFLATHVPHAEVVEELLP